MFKGYYFDKNHQPSPSNTKSTTAGNGENETEGQNTGKPNANYGYRDTSGAKYTGKPNILPPNNQ